MTPPPPIDSEEKAVKRYYLWELARREGFRNHDLFISDADYSRLESELAILQKKLEEAPPITLSSLAMNKPSPRSEPKRYFSFITHDACKGLCHRCGEIVTIEDSDGDYVTFAECQLLQKQVEELRAELLELRGQRPS